MNKIMYKEIIAVIFFCLMISGCKSPKSLENDSIKKLPESFSSTKDSISSANINWKNYFSDPNLIKLIEVALKNNLDISIALQRIDVAKADARLRKGQMLPNLNAGVIGSQRKFGLYTMDGAGNISTDILPGQIVPIHLPDYYVGLQTSWEVDIWGKLRNKKKAALSRYFSSVEAKNLVITNLIAELANSYYELLALDNELEIIEETIKLQKNAFEIVSVLKEVGASNKLAVKQLEAKMLNSQSLEYETVQKIIVVENKINFLLNRYPQKIERKKTDFIKPLPFKINVGIPGDLLKNRPDIRQAEFDLMASKANVKSAKAAFYPSLNITGAYGYQAFKTSFLFTGPESVAYSLIGSLMAPLINRNAIKAEFKTANAKQQEALFNYQKTILTGYTEVYNELANIKNLEKIRNLKTSEVDALAEAIDASSELFKTGKINYIEVLMVQKSSLNSKLELVNAKKRQYNAVVDIYKALGGGWQ